MGLATKSIGLMRKCEIAKGPQFKPVVGQEYFWRKRERERERIERREREK